MVLRQPGKPNPEESKRPVGCPPKSEEQKAKEAWGKLSGAARKAILAEELASPDHTLPVPAPASVAAPVPPPVQPIQFVLPRPVSRPLPDWMSKERSATLLAQGATYQFYLEHWEPFIGAGGVPIPERKDISMMLRGTNSPLKLMRQHDNPQYKNIQQQEKVQSQRNRAVVAVDEDGFLLGCSLTVDESLAKNKKMTMEEMVTLILDMPTYGASIAFVEDKAGFGKIKHLFKRQSEQTAEDYDSMATYIAESGAIL